MKKLIAPFCALAVLLLVGADAFGGTKRDEIKRAALKIDLKECLMPHYGVAIYSSDAMVVNWRNAKSRISHDLYGHSVCGLHNKKFTMTGHLHVWTLTPNHLEMLQRKQSFIKKMVKWSSAVSPFNVLGMEPYWEPFQVGEISGERACVLFEREWTVRYKGTSMAPRTICAAVFPHEGRRIMFAILPQVGTVGSKQMLPMLKKLLGELVLTTPELDVSGK